MGKRVGVGGRWRAGVEIVIDTDNRLVQCTYIKIHICGIYLNPYI